jgi:ribose transport system substrate-binding protein
MKNLGRNEMFRRYLCVATCLAALACVPAHADDLLSDQGLAQCFVKATEATPTIAAKHKTGPFRIAFSNSLYGNNWRTEMLNAVGAYVKQPDVAKHISEFKIYNSGNDVSQQISQIREMILAGYDAIVINAASPSGLNSVINQAVAQGIVVVSFDNVVTTAKAINVNEDQREMGRLWGEFLAARVPDGKSILIVHGLAGATVDNDQAQGAMSVFKKHPGLSVVDVYGNWDVGTNQKVTADALSTHHDIGGIWGTEGATGALQAAVQAAAPIVAITSESDNGFMQLAAERKIPALVIGQSPSLAAVAVRAAIASLSGKDLPQSANVPLSPIETADMKPEADYFPKLPGSFVTNINIAKCGVQIPVTDIVK